MLTGLRVVSYSIHENVKMFKMAKLEASQLLGIEEHVKVFPASLLFSLKNHFSFSLFTFHHDQRRIFSKDIRHRSLFWLPKFKQSLKAPPANPRT